jgi:hypothetical protein
MRFLGPFAYSKRRYEGCSASSSAEVNSMKTYLRRISLLAGLVLLSGGSAAAQTASDDFYRQWVDYRDGEISVDFDRTPIPFALHAIHAKTGFQIVMPSPADPRVLNLRLQRQPLEPAIRSLISTIGYRNFALLYDENGRPSRAVVLNAPPVIAKPAEERANNGQSKPTLGTDEQEKLRKELGRWSELKQEERSRIEDRLKELQPSAEREQLISEYGRQVLGLNK